jgi:hypothetical protein
MQNFNCKAFDSSVHAAPIMNAKAGPNTFHISGSGSSPFKSAMRLERFASQKVKCLKRDTEDCL